MKNINTVFNLDILSKIKLERLPLLTFKDWLNKFKQNLKYRYLPFRLYHHIRCYKYAKYRNPELKLISTLVNKDQVSIDVGANLGLFTSFMSKASAQVYAFEPNPYPLENLKGLVDKNVTVLPIALGNIDESTEIRIPHHENGWSSNGASLARSDEDNGKLITIECRKLDSLNIQNVGFIKIDVEGFEIEVLKGAEKIIARDKPSMIIENEEVHTKDTNELFRVMNDYGYDKYICNADGELEMIDEYSVRDNQKDAQIKDINYIQNFIFIAR